MGKIIGFMGAGGVGKTTTAQALAERSDYKFAPSVSRACFEKHGVKTEADQYAMSEDQKFALQQDIFKAKIVQDKELRESPFNWVCDRTPFDQLSYSYLRCMAKIDQALFGSMMQEAILASYYYQALFYFPLHTFPAHSDGMREDTFCPRWVLDTLIRRTSQELVHRIKEVPVMGVIDRAHFIMRTLK
jgi:predicted ATPase